MARDCGHCAHCKLRDYKVTHGQRNVSGGLVWYRIWSKIICELWKRVEGRNCKWFEGNRRYKEGVEKYRKWRAEYNAEILNASI